MNEANRTIRTNFIRFDEEIRRGWSVEHIHGDISRVAQCITHVVIGNVNSEVVLRLLQDAEAERSDI